MLRKIFADRRNSGRLDLEAVEQLVRDSVHHMGATALSHLLREDPPQQTTIPCSCGHSAKYKELRPRPVLTVIGPVEILRPYYVCAHCNHAPNPTDAALDIVKTDDSPGVRRMMALVGSESPFRLGRQQLEWLAGLQVTVKAVERHSEQIGADIAAREHSEIQRSVQLQLPIPLGPSISILYVQMDATGVPVKRSETQGRAGKRDGEPAHTREVKLGCVFTQTTTDTRGRPIRDETSTTFTGAIESAPEFARRIYHEAFRRGWSRARIKVILGDGAIWIWNIAEEHFPGAILIVDLYHAREHLHKLARLLFPNDEGTRKAWAKPQLDLLDDGQIESLVAALRARQMDSPELAATLRTEADYFERNADKMRYPKFRSQGLFVGSGVIEAACKTVIGSRLKKSGMFWTVEGANAIIALRCCLLSGRFEDYWEARASKQAA